MEYGSAMEHGRVARKTFNNDFFPKGQRKRLNAVSILIALFVPWLLFCFVFGVLSFAVHYTRPWVAYALIALAFWCGVCVPAALAAHARRRKVFDATYQPSWYFFLAVSCVLAFVVGGLVGQSNYSSNMVKYYNLLHMARYQDVDTNLYVGQQLMDAGRIDFKQGTELDLSRSMGFKSHDVYCVSPIMTRANSGKPASVDFWAVGKNCCSGVSADFHCPGFSDRSASAVVRLMHDEDRPFYRLAVQQAEATYQMTATHPLFFEWVHNGEEATNSMAQRGYTNYFLGICSYLLLQIFLTVAATLVFSKI